NFDNKGKGKEIVAGRSSKDLDNSSAAFDNKGKGKEIVARGSSKDLDNSS
ncbi:23289_t:CDS:2, partial [Racocetra persica]